jgi:predicted Zn-dependent protease
MCLAFLSMTIFSLTVSACAVKHASIQSGTIPQLFEPSPGAEKYGKSLFYKLRADCELESDNQKRGKLIEIFNQLTKAADVNHLPWHIYLLNGPEIADVRAVHGNYLFVWSGVFDAVENDDELAGLLAFELSHSLAHHTDPVEFTIASDVLFSVAELATSLGILVASHGMVVIGGHGWMKWAYIEVADLDPLDREYGPEQEREAAGIALLIIERTHYSSQAALNFWQRAAADKSLQDKTKRLSRSLSPQERVAMLEEVFLNHTKGNKQFVKMPPP